MPYVLDANGQLKVAIVGQDPAGLKISQLYESDGGGPVLTVGATSQLQFQPLADTATIFQILPSGGGTPVFNVDTTNARIGVNDASPSAALEVVTSGTGESLRMTGTNTSHCVNLNSTLSISSTGIAVVRAVPTLDPQAALAAFYNLNNNLNIGGSGSSGITSLYSQFIRATFQDSYGGTVAIWNGLYVGDIVDLSSGSPAVTTSYGLRVLDLSFATNNYAIRTGDGKVIFGDVVSVNAGLNPAAQLHVDQSSTVGAIPVMTLDQADASEEYINFISAATGAGNPIDTATAVGTAYARARVAVNGTFKYIQLYNA
jgi:hypothetical protein